MSRYRDDRYATSRADRPQHPTYFEVIAIMDQVKEILKQMIKYRFWIAVGISLLLPMAAYFMGSGPIKAKAAAETSAIETAHKDVGQYSQGVVPNAQYKPLVVEKKDELAKDVRASHKKLYARQAPLLTWPERVKGTFDKWGRTWPENVDASTVQIAIIDYVNAYPKYVDEVYASFRPFDPAQGTGVIRAPSEEELLRPAKFSNTSPPTLGKVWVAQERLWVQRTLLDVVAQVNQGAKNWDTAIIKQVNMLEVGSPGAQDQRSLAKGDTLEETADITAPGVEAAPAAEDTSGGSTQTAKDSLYYIKTDSTQYKIIPVALSVLVEQDRIQDVLCALENSPMSIDVKDFEMAKPSTRVTRPEKGESRLNFQAMLGNGVPGRYGSYAAPVLGGVRVSGFGGAAGLSRGAATGGRKGISKRDEDRAEKLKSEREKAAKTTAYTIHDPFFNIVEVTVFGQARFYNPPPPDEPAPEPSTAEAAEAPEGEAAKKAEAPKPETAKDETAKDSAEKKAEPAKEEMPKEEAEKKAEPAKTESSKAKADTEPAKASAETPKPKAEPAKAKADDETPKKDAEPAKADAAEKKAK
jgi:hypothetical protein